MGMYTELSMRCGLKKDVPQYVIETLKYMLDYTLYPELKEGPEETREIITGRQTRMLQLASYSFHPYSKSSLDYNPIVETYYFSTMFSIKNYEKEIEKFVEWLTPFIDADDGTFLGYKLYEEGNEPQLLIHPNKWK